MRSKAAVAGAAGGMFIAVWAWSSAAGWQGSSSDGLAAGAGTEVGQGTVVRRVYIVQRTAPDGSTYTDALPALPDGSPPPGLGASVAQLPAAAQQQPRQKPRPVTRTRAS